MIELFIFHVHAMAGLYAFTKRWQEGKLREGFMALAIFFLVFIIMRTLTGQIVKALVPAEGFATWFTRDTGSLVLVIIPDLIFFKVFFLNDRTEVKPLET